MSNYILSVSGIDKLEKRLIQLNSIRFEAIVEDQLTEMFNRTRKDFTLTGEGTPFDTGELKNSASRTNDTVGYTEEYAAHVEYGHRTVNGGYVPGQRYLMRNVDVQREIYRNDLLTQIKKEGG